MAVALQIRRARESLRLPLEKAAEQLNLAADKLRAWEEGKQEPSFDDLCDLADVYHRSVDFFLRDIAPPKSPLSLRLARGRRQLSPEAEAVCVRWVELCRWRSELEETLGRKRPPSLPECPASLDPTDMARDVRTRLRIGSGPIENLRTLLEKQGIYVFMLPLPKGELSGCSRWDERYAPAILVNARDDSGRRNFSMAHEYYHLLVHPKEAHGCGVEITAEPGEERSANRFAATFLMTREGLAAALRERERRGHPRRAKDYAPLAADWHVSAQALLYALKDFGLMPPQEADRLIDEWATLKLPLRWPKGKPRPTLWDRYVQQLGEPYTHAALAAYREGHISLSKLAHYLGIDIRKARKATEESR